MSGENIQNLLLPEPTVAVGSYSGTYEKRMKDLPKPTYSTFYDKNKEYDSTHPRYFKQRSAVMAPIVNETVNPSTFLRTGAGIKNVVPPIPHRKIHKRDVLDNGTLRPKCHGGKLEGINGMPGSNHQNSHTDTKEPHQTVATCDKNPQEFQNDEVTHFHEREDNPCEDSSNKNNEYVLNSVTDAQDHNKAGQHDAVVFENSNCHQSAMQCATKNFVTSNIIQACNMVTKRKKNQPENLTARESFGQVPKYLNRVKDTIRNEREQIKAVEELRRKQQKERLANYVYQLNEPERVELVKRLRAKLCDKEAELNKMPFAKDTFNQLKHKAELEKTIKEIEQALVKLEKDAVFIINDDPRFVHWTKDLALEESRLFASRETS
ncbi:hypothetical protein TRVL_01232 [Trypanosoma vivax]|nr:hypothetical protein TRVL_01232 [Trypanosoma vivax]